MLTYADVMLTGEAKKQKEKEQLNSEELMMREAQVC
jgi:hypothetical protein